jgi:two-component system, OmpR family, response regulator
LNAAVSLRSQTMMDILIVDDDKNALRMLELHLSRAGFKTTSCLDSAEAEKLLKKRSFDWLVVDGQLSPFSGFELSDRARKLAPAMRIVMVSGVYDKADIAGHPIEKIFIKPIDTEALARHLHGEAKPA